VSPGREIRVQQNEGDLRAMPALRTYARYTAAGGQVAGNYYYENRKFVIGGKDVADVRNIEATERKGIESLSSRIAYVGGGGRGLSK